MINDDKFKKKSIESYCRLKKVCSVFRFFHTSVKKKETLKADSLNNLHIELLIQRIHLVKVIDRKDVRVIYT